MCKRKQEQASYNETILIHDCKRDNCGRRHVSAGAIKPVQLQACQATSTLPLHVYVLPSMGNASCTQDALARAQTGPPCLQLSIGEIHQTPYLSALFNGHAQNELTLIGFQPRQSCSWCGIHVAKITAEAHRQQPLSRYGS